LSGSQCRWEIDIYDATLANWCRIYGIAHNHVGSVVHNHCDFPRNITNPEDSTLLGITAYDLGQNYLDISIINPYCRVNGYQFTLQGAEVLQVQSLLNGSVFPAYLDHTENQVMGISIEDSSIAKHILPYGICRIFFTNQTGPIAISEITQIINADHEQVPTGIFGDTVMLSGTGSVSNVRYQVNPNPAIDFIYITGDFSEHPVEEVRWYDLPGRRLHTDKPSLANPWQLSLAMPHLPAGIYMLEMKHPEGTETKRLVVK